MKTKRKSYTVEDLRNAWDHWVSLREAIECYQTPDFIPSKAYEMRNNAWNAYVDVRDGLPPGTTSHRSSAYLNSVH